MPVKKLKVQSEKLKVSDTSKQVIRGLVVEAGKLTQTVTVLVSSRKMHPLYKKSVKRTKRFLVHDPLGVKEGDLVEMHQCRPISKNKHWVVSLVVGQDLELMVGEQLQQGVDEAIAEVMPEVEEESRIESQESSEDEKTVKPKIKNKTKKTKEIKKEDE